MIKKEIQILYPKYDIIANKNIINDFIRKRSEEIQTVQKKEINLGYCSISYVVDSGYSQLQTDNEIEIDRNEIVYNKKSIKLEIDYPLDVSAFFDLVADNKKNFTRSELVEKICKSYQQVYSEPDKYKIWGHDIEDLILHTAHIENDVMTVNCDS